MTHPATAEGRDLQASLDAFATLPEWLASTMRPERIEQSLREHVPAFGDGRLLACMPQRLRAKGDQWIARYALTVAAQDGGEPDEVVLVGQLYAPGVDVPADVSAPQEEGSYWLPDLRLALHVETADPGLPALPSLVEPEAASRMLSDVLRDAGYGDVDITECRPEVVRYKPGSRCTVVVGLEYGQGGAPGAADRTPPDLVVLKPHQGDKGATAWEAMKALWERPVAQEGTVRLAEPLAFLPDERILVQGPLARTARSRSSRGRRSPTGATARWTTCARSWRRPVTPSRPCTRRAPSTAAPRPSKASWRRCARSSSASPGRSPRWAARPRPC